MFGSPIRVMSYQSRNHLPTTHYDDYCINTLHTENYAQVYNHNEAHYVRVYISTECGSSSILGKKGVIHREIPGNCACLDTGHSKSYFFN